jgi:hypothetical protein
MVNKIGEYLEREVQIVSIDNYAGLLSDDITPSATIMMYYCRRIDDLECNEIIEMVVKENPLAIFIGGENADHVFDIVLQYLDKHPGNSHIMTRVSNGSIDECIEEFLQATWPSEDRWDEWRTYTIIAYADNTGQLQFATHKILNLGR